MKDKLTETLEVNKRQKEFYNSTAPSKKNFASKIWSKIRNNTLNDYRKQFDIKERVYAKHKVWLGDLQDKKVLDLGCLRGNALSLYIAENAKEYIGIDLSDVAINDLKKRLIAQDCKNAEAIAVDFLSDEFKHVDFDIIYAYGVLHHFEDIDILINKLNEKLAPNGTIISYDPLETSTPIKILRTLYRPFQSDKDWEWPFKKSTLKKFSNSFIVEEKKGILGRSKYGILLSILPLNASYKNRVIKNMIKKDWDSNNWSQIYSCMHLTMLLRKK